MTAFVHDTHCLGRLNPSSEKRCVAHFELMACWHSSDGSRRFEIESWLGCESETLGKEIDKKHGLKVSNGSCRLVTGSNGRDTCQVARGGICPFGHVVLTNGTKSLAVT